MKTIATQCGLCSAPLTLDVPDIVQQGAVFAMCPACQQQDHIEAGGLITGLVEPIVGKLAIRRVETTPGAAAALADAKQGSAEFLARHAAGDWGAVGKADSRQFTKALAAGRGGVQSVFKTSKGADLWVMTDLGGDGLTSVLTPEEY
jgi:hypothetical protein